MQQNSQLTTFAILESVVRVRSNRAPGKQNSTAIANPLIDDAIISDSFVTTREHVNGALLLSIFKCLLDHVFGI
jgi:hypothetical protein